MRRLDTRSVKAIWYLADNKNARVALPEFLMRNQSIREVFYDEIDVGGNDD